MVGANCVRPRAFAERPYGRAKFKPTAERPYGRAEFSFSKRLFAFRNTGIGKYTGLVFDVIYLWAYNKSTRGIFNLVCLKFVMLFGMLRYLECYVIFVTLFGMLRYFCYVAWNATLFLLRCLECYVTFVTQLGILRYFCYVAWNAMSLGMLRYFCYAAWNVTLLLLRCFDCCFNLTRFCARFEKRLIKYS